MLFIQSFLTWVEMREEKKGNTTDAAHGIFVLPDDAQCFSALIYIYVCMYKT